MAKVIQKQLEEAELVYARGDRDVAISLYRDILRQSPQEPEALHMMGVIAQQMGNSRLALKLIEAALAVKSDFARAWYNRTVVLRASQNNAEALRSARMTLELSPESGEAWDLLGQILKTEGDLVEAHRCHSRAIELQPRNPHFHDNYALLFLTSGNLAAAYEAAYKATMLDPAFPPVNLGNTLHAMGYPERAAELFSRARTMRPELTGVAINEAIALLQMGDMEQGLKLWEQRREFESFLNTVPLWQGQKVSRLLLHEEQGFGDLIQLLRYIPLLKTRAEHIEAYVRAPLHRLCAENFPYVNLLAEDSSGSSADARCRWSSAPFFFDTRPDTISAPPYLTSSIERRMFWHDKLRDVPKPRIGLVWAGGKATANDAQRSLDVTAFDPLLTCGADHFVSLQKDRSEKMAGIFDTAHLLGDFADTAALIDELDLVVTVDTAVAHLAGALGKPVFILLPSQSDWHWMLGREDSPWYPTARLLRQRKPGDWATVIENLSTDVRKFIVGDKSVLQPPAWNGEYLRQHPDALSLPQ